MAKMQTSLLGKAAVVLAASIAMAGTHLALATTQKTKQVDLADVKQEKRVKQKKEVAQSRLGANEAFLVATETRLLSEIQKALNYLTKTAARLPKKSTDRLQMRDKIINLRLEAAVYYSNQEMRKYDKSWEQWDQGGRKGPEPKLDSSRSKGQWKALYADGQNLLEEYPKSPKADETLFNMGLSQKFLAQDKEAARIFSQLISKYPNSQKAGDAYFALGDFYFERNDFRNATNNYKNALRFKQSKSYSWALFKLGWCSYNLQQYNQSLNYWKQTVVEAGRGGKKGLALKEEALRDMVFSFAELRQIEPAISYYRRNGGAKFIGRFLLLLAQTLADQGQFNEAINVLKRYQQEEPTDEGGPDTQKEIINLNFELSRLPQVWAELARFPKMYGPGSRWAEKNGASNKKLVLETQQMIKDQIIYYAKLTHKNAQKDDNKALYEQAMKGYTLFLTNYPKSVEVAEMKFNMADIYYFNKNYREAARLYLEICLLGKDKAVIVDPKTQKKQNIHKDSAEYMLDGYVREFDPEYKVMLKRKPDFAKGALPLTENAKNVIKGCGYYEKWYPGEKNNIKNCDVVITAIHYRSNDKKNAMKYLWLLAKKYPGSKEGEEAVDLLIPLYGSDKVALAKATDELSKIPAYRKGKIGQKLDDLNRGVQKDVFQAEKNKCTRAAKAKAFYEKYPKDKDAPNVIYNAAGDYILCGKIPEGLAAYQIVLNKHPTSEGAKPALLEVAKIQERRLEIDAASAYYLQYAKRYPKEKEGVAALAKSCILQAASNSASAVTTCLSFAQADEGTAKAVFQRMMRSAFSAGSEAKLVSLVQTFDSKFRATPEERIVAYAMIYNLSKGSGVGQQAASQIMGTFQKSGGSVAGEALRAVGALTFRQVNGELARFQQIKLKGGSVDQLVQSIQVKGAAMGKLEQAYGQVLQTKDAYWGVAALYQMGYAHEIMANDMENPPAIAGAKKEDVVKELAAAIKENKAAAAKFYQSASESVEKFLVYNEWAAKALSGRARLGGKNVNFDDIIVRPDFLGAEVPESIARAVRGGGEE